MKVTHHFFFIFLFFFTASSASFAVTTAEYMQKKIQDKYFHSNEEKTKEFIAEMKEDGIFVPSEWEKIAKKKALRDAEREKKLNYLARKYFFSDMDALEKVREKVEGDTELIPRDLQKRIIAEKKKQDLFTRFQQEIAHKYFDSELWEAEIFFEDFYEDHSISQMRQILETEKKYANQIQELADEFFDGDTLFARGYTRDARKDGIFVPASWWNKAEDEREWDKNVTGNLKILARYYFDGDMEALEKFIEKEKKAGNTEISAWREKLRIEKMETKDLERIKKYFFEWVFKGNQEFTDEYFKEQKSAGTNMRSIRDLRVGVQKFKDRNNKEQYKEMVKERDEKLKQFVEDEYFPTFSWRKLSEEAELKRKSDLKAFLADSEKMKEARKLQVFWENRKEFSGAITDRIDRLNEEKRNIVRLLLENNYPDLEDEKVQKAIDALEKKDRTVFVEQIGDRYIQKQEMIYFESLMSANYASFLKDELSRYQKWAETERIANKKVGTKEVRSIDTALQEVDFQLFVALTKGEIRGHSVQEEDFLLLVALKKATDANDEEKSAEIAAKLSRFMVQKSPAFSFERKQANLVKRAIRRGNFENFQKNLPEDMKSRFSQASFDLLRSIRDDYRSYNFAAIAAKKDLLDLKDDEWKAFRSLFIRRG